MSRRVLLFSVMVMCLLTLGCSAIPSGERVGSLVISKAEDAAAHAGGRYLQKKTSRIETESRMDDGDLHPSSYSESVVRSDTQTRHFDAVSVKARARPLLDMLLAALSSALGWERIKPKADYPSDSLVKFFTGSSISDSGKGSKQRQRITSVGRYHDRQVSLGFRWRF